MDLLKKIKELQKSNIKKIVETRLGEFGAFKDKPNDAWFSELCFCLLTANSKARTAIAIQKELGFKGFSSCNHKELSSCIRRNKHRFHNNKAHFIIGAREYIDIKRKIQNIVDGSGQIEAREFLVKNIKGLGYKEASHFLRNVGYFDLSILDRHILNLFVDYGLLKEKPKSLTKKIYLENELIFRNLAKKLNMSCAELDLYMWYMKTGEVLK